MRNPTKAQVQVVIDTFLEDLPAAEKLDEMGICSSSIDMDNGSVNHFCNTPMCHAGWYAAAKKDGFNYYDGANVMANDLGQGHRKDLTSWADQNPELWGNDSGDDMFLNERAFNYSGTLTLGKIINHWKEVQKRLPE